MREGYTIFEIPKSRRIIISGGSDVIARTSDNYPTAHIPQLLEAEFDYI